MLNIAPMCGVRIIEKDKELIERIQHKFTKMITDLNHLLYLERLHQLNLWKLEDRRIHSD